MEDIQYYEEYMEASDVDAAEKRNEHKSTIMYKLYSTGKVQDFIEFISGTDIAVPGTYKETWKFIQKDKNSLQRHSNMHLIFE